MDIFDTGIQIGRKVMAEVEKAKHYCTADLQLALVGGALRDHKYNRLHGGNIQAKDFDYIIIGDFASQWDAFYNRLLSLNVDECGIEYIKFIDSYHAPRIARRGLAGIIKMKVDGYDVDLLCYDGYMDLDRLEQEIGRFDMDVNQSAVFLGDDGYMSGVSTRAFLEAHESKTFKILDREVTEDGSFTARELQRLLNVQTKLTGYEMLDFPEFMERLDYFGGLEAAMQASKPVACCGMTPEEDDTELQFK